MLSPEIVALLVEITLEHGEPCLIPESPMPETLVMDRQGNLFDPLTGEIHVEAWS